MWCGMQREIVDLFIKKEKKERQGGSTKSTPRCSKASSDRQSDSLTYSLTHTHSSHTLSIIHSLTLKGRGERKRAKGEARRLLRAREGTSRVSSPPWRWASNLRSSASKQAGRQAGRICMRRGEGEEGSGRVSEWDITRGLAWWVQA